MSRLVKKNKGKTNQTLSFSKRGKGKLKPVGKLEQDTQSIQPETQVVKTAVKWDDAYPFVLETHKNKTGSTTDVPKYFSSEENSFEKFLYEVVRANNVPPFMKNNFKKIRKLLEKEIEHRTKLVEKLSREQSAAICNFFSDNLYFARTTKSEFYEHELEKVYVDYLKNYCGTGSYDARVRIANRKRKDLLQTLQNGKL